LDRIVIGNQDVARTLELSTNGKDGESTPEEGMGRIGYFDFIRRY